MNKATQLMSSNKSVKDRSEKFAVSIKRDIQKSILDKIQTEIENYEDKLFELEDFTLETNLNAGKAAISKDQCQKRFEDIIETEYQITLLKAELEVKQATFNKYFGE